MSLSNYPSASADWIFIVRNFQGTFSDAVLGSTFFAYSPLIRKMIYTTNAIESLNSQFRKVTKNINPFPDEELLIKRLWLAQQNISKKWQQPLQRWEETMMELAGRFPDRISID